MTIAPDEVVANISIQPVINPETEMEIAHPHVLVIGDAADAYGAINVGHPAFGQASTVFVQFIILNPSCLTVYFCSGRSGCKKRHQTRASVVYLVYLFFIPASIRLRNLKVLGN